MIASKIIQRNLTKEDNERLIDEALKQVEGRRTESASRESRELDCSRCAWLLIVAALQLRLRRRVGRIRRRHLPQQRARLVEAALPESHHPQQKPDRRPIVLRDPCAICSARAAGSRSPASIRTTPRSRCTGGIVFVQAARARRTRALTRRKRRASSPSGGPPPSLISPVQRRDADRARRIVERGEQRRAADAAALRDAPRPESAADADRGMLGLRRGEQRGQRARLRDSSPGSRRRWPGPAARRGVAAIAISGSSASARRRGRR